MLKSGSLFFFLIFFLTGIGFAQTPCTELGQNPGTAFPVCGTDTFSITSVAICGDRQVPGPCNNVPLTDKNPYWYKFTCFTEGTLGFVITPNTITDDYDWQIFDITNRNPNDVYTDATLFVACNWSGDGGLTGASTAGTSLSRCDGPGVPRFSTMPSLIKDHEYLLLVSHFSNSQSGYALSFGGGTASITDPIDPKLVEARVACDSRKIGVKLNKKMKCSSLATDGSDFSISPALATITSTEAASCNNGFDMDSVVLILSNPLPAGNYTVRIETGSDGNNLLDNCNRGIPAAQTLPLSVLPMLPTAMDSLTKPGCAPEILELVFKDPIRCNSIAADGSDFVLNGPAAITVTGASGECNGTEQTKIIRVRLSAPLHTAGAFLLSLKMGSDGNTLINECNVATPAGASTGFITRDTVSAQFTSIHRLGCNADTVNYLHDGRNGVDSWTWNFEGNVTRSTRNTQVVYTTTGVKEAVLIVSNGTCSDTANTSISTLDTKVTAAFQSTAVVCPGDPATFTHNSTGPIIDWNWNFGNGAVSFLAEPPSQLYPSNNIVTDIPVRLVVKNVVGCADTATNMIRVVGNCYIAVPKGFSPNNDGLNDYLYPTNAYKARDLLFRIYNRNGQLIFETQNWTTKWDGTYKGNPQDPGTYVWILSYTNIDSGSRFELKGSTVLIR